MMGQLFVIQTCFIVMAGLQSLSSSRIDRHTVPDGYTFGWNSGGSNLPETTNHITPTHVNLNTSEHLHMERTEGINLSFSTSAILLNSF